MNTRPDPDDLLAQLRAEEGRAGRGKLRIYFGASAGVGKTYAMLAAARREHQAGRDLVVGLVETHGRSDTALLAEGLPPLQRRRLPHQGRELEEFDLDAALARRPAILLVDELAHSNVPGSRHAKRWQDVQELLDAGIEVWSTLNVQHLESLNDTVGAITGIRVHETVPDTVLDEADEVVLVDVTPEELIARLKAGKVYLPQQAERAAQNFFRKGNLIALREIALRRTAEHVEDDVRRWRVEQSIAPVWNTGGAILACVGPNEGAEQGVRTAARLAGQLNVRWHAAYVETPKLRQLAPARRDRILAVLRLAEELGAATAVLAGNDVAAELVAHAQEMNCAVIVTGRPAAAAGWRRIGRRTMTRQLATLAPALDIVEVGRGDSARRLPALVQRAAAAEEAPRARSEPWPRYAWAAASSIAVTLVCTPLHSVFDLANIVMIYLLAVVGVAMRLGRGPAALAAFLNVAAFDFFFVSPRLSFAVSDVQYLVTFGVMLGVGLLTGQLTAGLRFSAHIAQSREQRAQSLFELARDLSGALLASQVAELGEAAVRRHFGGQARVLLPDARDALVVPEGLPEGFDASVADWAFRNGQPAGLATTTLAAQAWHYVALQAPMRVRGVLALCPAQPRWLFIPEQRRQLDTLARQVAIALERVHYVEIAQQAVVDMESERLRNTLLAAISHDVRTPLTALIGLAESLRQSQPRLAPSQAANAQAIAEQARELAALVNNLLDMARLQSGRVNLRLEWQSVEEAVGSALRAARTALAGQAVKTDIPPGLPLVEFDAALIERVLVNLLENAARHGRAPIEVAARAPAGELLLRVRDHGPGLPVQLAGRESQLFEKFTRGQSESATPGVGLGLAICKAVVDAHGGRIEAANAPGGGAEFTVRLPRREPPAVPDDPPAEPSN
jgi:two-component system, OmpR family, sensor histidine kinase KdpD